MYEDDEYDFIKAAQFWHSLRAGLPDNWTVRFDSVSPSFSFVRVITRAPGDDAYWGGQYVRYHFCNDKIRIGKQRVKTDAVCNNIHEAITRLLKSEQERQKENDNNNNNV